MKNCKEVKANSNGIELFFKKLLTTFKCLRLWRLIQQCLSLRLTLEGTECGAVDILSLVKVHGWMKKAVSQTMLLLLELVQIETCSR